MCQSHDKNVDATAKMTNINHQDTKSRQRKIMGALMPFAKFGLGLFMTGLNIAARVFITMPIYAFWLIAFVYFQEGLGNVEMYFESILHTSFYAAVIYIALYVFTCFSFNFKCRIIHNNLRNIR